MITVKIKKVGSISLLSLVLLSFFITSANAWPRKKYKKPEWRKKVEITITTDKEVYGVEETAFFSIEMKQADKLVMIRPKQLEATFPDENTPVTLTQLSQGEYYTYITPEFTEVGDYTLTVTVRLYGAVKSIENLEKVKQRFEERIEWLKELKEKVKNKRKKKCIDRLMAIYQRIIQRIESSIDRIRERSIIGTNSCTITVKIKYTKKMEEAFESGDWESLCTYAETLMQEGSEAIPELVEVLKDKEKDPVFRKMIAEIIAEIKDITSTPSLISVLSDETEDESIRAEKLPSLLGRQVERVLMRL